MGQGDEKIFITFSFPLWPNRVTIVTMHWWRAAGSAFLLILFAFQVGGQATSAPCDSEHHQESQAGHEAMGHEQGPGPSCDHTSGQGAEHSPTDCAVMFGCVSGAAMEASSRGLLNFAEASPAIAAASWTPHARAFLPDFPPPKS